MTKLSDLVPSMSKILHVPQKTVNVIAMHLRREGLISSSGRGRGGAEMTARDAAVLLLGIMAAEQLKDAPTLVKDLGSYRYTETFYEQTDRYADDEDEDNSKSEDNNEPGAVDLESNNPFGMKKDDTLLDSITILIDYFLQNIDLTEGDRYQWPMLFIIQLTPRKDFCDVVIINEDSSNIIARHFSPVLIDGTHHLYSIHDLKIVKHYDLIRRIEVTDNSIRNIARALANLPLARWKSWDDKDPYF